MVVLKIIAGIILIISGILVFISNRKYHKKGDDTLYIDCMRRSHIYQGYIFAIALLFSGLVLLIK